VATPRYPLLDSMRGVAALSVFAAHALIFLFACGTEEARPLMTRLDPGVGLVLPALGLPALPPYAVARFRGKQAPSVVPCFRGALQSQRGTGDEADSEQDSERRAAGGHRASLIGVRARNWQNLARGRRTLLPRGQGI
jgi:hypothetical protein